MPYLFRSNCKAFFFPVQVHLPAFPTLISVWPPQTPFQTVAHKFESALSWMTTIHLKQATVYKPSHPNPPVHLRLTRLLDLAAHVAVAAHQKAAPIRRLH